MNIRHLTLTAVIAAVLAVPAHAQVKLPPYGANANSWGVSGTFVPQWQFLDFLEDSMERSIEMTGSDFHIGIVRGRHLGGEWGASYIKRRVDNGSTLLDENTKCLARPGQPNVCARGTIQRTTDATLTGLQFHRFFPFGTIAGRVQIGAVISGGFGRVRGQAEQTQEHLQITVNPVTGVTTIGIQSESEIIEARDIFDHLPVAEYLPMGGLEGAVAVLVAPGVKVRLSAGANFPGFHRLAISAQYLFGSR